MEAINLDLFGDPVIEKNDLRKKYVVPPFSVLDTVSGEWQSRKDMWRGLGIKSEVGRKATTFNMYEWNKNNNASEMPPDTSIFDPVLCEIMYKWFAPKRGSILDPFAGGSVRGIVANYLGYDYTGIELREEQVYANMQQGIDIVPDNTPTWIIGDSNNVMDTMDRKFDFIFTCPPYYDLEKYSSDRRDLSHMDEREFNWAYRSIIKKSCILLKDNSFACFVVGNVRNKKGFIRDLVGLTVKSFEDNGVHYYNDLILRQVVGSGSMRADGNMKYKKIVKMHQNVLVFCKGDPKLR